MECYLITSLKTLPYLHILKVKLSNNCKINSTTTTTTINNHNNNNNNK